MIDEEAIATVRAELSRRFISGHGLEIGGGTRPFPVPTGAKVSYGDIRDPVSLKSYFKTDAVQSGEPIDAQTLAGIADASLDFVISAHVIEHLRDPIGAIVNAIRVLEHGGIHLLVVPDMRRTFDRDRPETSVAHVLADFSDGGIGTCRDGYEAFAVCASDSYRPALLGSGNSTPGDRSGQALAKVRRSFPRLDSSGIRGAIACRV